ncbi:Abhydrolase domain-containing protein 15 [Oryzias melastigma]|uniref:Abhydrolase domain-containing protein 15 n=1 Tax=Oryzias melastigma TaxID=30732 RepID=A0A834BW79_ORYME|nr:Abhydrolase domain-containing protein 15 [Oryzias melastigma]
MAQGALLVEAGCQSCKLEFVGGKPDGARFICKATALAQHVQQHCSSLNTSNLASWPRGDPHLQTVSGQLCGRYGDPVQFTRENLLLKDGGMVALDWAVGTRHDDGGVRKRWEPRREHQLGRKGLCCFTQTPPVLLLIPQSWGGMTPHLKLLSQEAMRQGFYVVVFHHRGTAGSPLCSARLTEFGDPSDLEEAVAYVHSRRPSSALFAVSEGSGSGVLLSYLGECGSSSHLTAAAAISPVLLGQLWFETPMPTIYRWGALFHRKQQLSRYENSLRGILDVDRALTSSSLKEFEESLFCASAQHQQQQSPLKGLAPSLAWTLGERAHPAKDWEGYWGRNEPLRDADEVAVPVLCVCSRDDPILLPASTLPLSLFLSNPYFLLVLTDRGGHCGFTQADEGREEEEEKRWSHILALEYFRVVADFLKYEENEETCWRRPLEGGQSAQRRTETPAVPRRRRTNVMRRTKAQSTEHSDDAERGTFTWKRSYTR